MSATTTLQDAQRLLDRQAALLEAYRVHLDAADRVNDALVRSLDNLEERIKWIMDRLVAFSADYKAVLALVRRTHETLGAHTDKTNATFISIFAALGEADVIDPEDLAEAVTKIHPAALAWLDQWRAGERDEKGDGDGS